MEANIEQCLAQVSRCPAKGRRAKTPNSTGEPGECNEFCEVGKEHVHDRHGRGDPTLMASVSKTTHPNRVKAEGDTKLPPKLRESKG